MTLSARALLRLSPVLLLALAVPLGCGDGGGGGPSEPPTNTAESLSALGVDLAETPRMGDDLMPLPESYAPLGARRTVNRFAELVMFGLDADEDAAIGATATESAAIDFSVDGSNRVQPELLDAGTESAPWTGANRKRAVSGDFDADGLDELAVVYQLEGETLDVVVRDDASRGFAVGASAVLGLDAVDEIFLASGDLDGDGVDDLVVATLGGGSVKVSFYLRRGDRFEPDRAALDLAAGSHVVLEAGNLDYDASVELAVVVNEGAGRSAGEASRARLFVYDDLGGGLEPLYAGNLIVTRPDEVLTVRGGDVALADVDGDGLDEVVLGGLTALGRLCNLETYAALEVWDDAVNDLAPLASSKERFIDRRQPCSSGASHRLSRFPIQGIDIDGDGVEEIHALQWIYEDLQTPEDGLIELATLPQEEWLAPASSGSRAAIHWSTTDFTVGDVNSDGREDLIYYTQRQNAKQVLQSWGMDMIDGWKLLAELETAFVNDDDQRPQVVAGDFDQDVGSMGLKYSAGSHELVFTAPVIIAALAAPPCAEDSGQNLSVCKTAFGTGMSSGGSDTSGWSVIAGVSVGFGTSFSVAGVKVGSAEAVLNTKNTLRNYTTKAYRLRTQVRRQTGPLEDSVIFTSLPYDVYTYEILSHPNPELVGESIEVRLPREPITIMATTEFYNARIEADAPRVDAAIFAHTPGDPTTYRSGAAKDRLLRSSTGVESDEVDVGQGSGDTRVRITRFESTTTGRKFQAEATLDVKHSKGGVIGGFKIGGGFDFEFRTTRGTETLYEGAVPNIPEGDLSNGYAFGLFAYLYTDPATDQTFEVLDYWVR